MTEMVTYTPPADTSTAIIAQAVQQMQGAHQLAKGLANTAFVPAHFRGKPDDVAAAILYGAAVGLDPMTTLRSIYVVSGTPGLYAKSMVALVQSRGHEVWTEESGDDTVTVAGRRRGSQHIERATWTIERAKRAEYVPTIDPKTGKYQLNDKSKLIGNMKYLTDPQAMLYARAASEVCRKIASDALAGLDHSAEELETIQAEAVIERPRRETATALLAAAPAEPAPEPMPITPAQRKRLAELMREGNINDKDDALAYVGSVAGRAVPSRELTHAEADAVITALEHDLAQAAPSTDDNQLLPDDPDLSAPEQEADAR